MAAMSDPSAADGFARELLDARPDRFAAALADLPEADRLDALAFARQLTATVRAMRATYVLHVASDLPSGAAGEAAAVHASLHLAGAFGHTGQLETVVSHERLAAAIAAHAGRHALAERIRVHAGDAPTVVRALNGPHDLVVAGARWREYERMGDHLMRLVRTGGALLVVNAGALPAALADGAIGDAGAASLQRFLRALVSDERYELGASRDFRFVLAARVR